MTIESLHVSALYGEPTTYESAGVVKTVVPESITSVDISQADMSCNVKVTSSLTIKEVPTVPVTPIS